MFLFRNSVLVLVALLSTAATALRHGQPYDYGLDLELALTKRAPGQNESQNALVVPIPYNGTIPLRLEIRELQKNSEQWMLYILALSWMQWMNQSDPLSWYRITGIHGAPFTDYGGVKAVPDNTANGYCTHVSNLFPTWHRPYMALYEQTVYKFVQTIASWFSDDRRETFQKAAVSFRIPYWDWAAQPPDGESVLPIAVGGSEYMEIDGPNGKQNISNPLFSYTFKPLNASNFRPPFTYWNETKRRPQPSQSPNATSDNGWVAQNLDNQLPSIQQRLYNLFANNGNYSTWSNEAWIPDANNASYDSIESLHDTIHLTCGGEYGHMAIIAYSSFDPIFFLHHANVDRLFAMWQIVHNDSYVEPMDALLATRTISTGERQDGLSDLTPFYFNDTNFWNSDQVRDHKVFGYSYADTVSGNRSDVVAAINRLYTDFSPARINMAHSQSTGEKDLSWDGQSTSYPPLELILKEGSYREWIANVHVNKHALAASFSVYFFVGTPPDAASDWDFANNKVGALGVFAGNHAAMGSQLIGGTVPLTSALLSLLSSGSLSSLDPKDVSPFLTQYFTFRIKHFDGSVVEPVTVSGLSISVATSLVKAPKNNEELAVWGEMSPVIDVF